MNIIYRLLLSISLIVISVVSFAGNLPESNFPMSHYNQHVGHWVSSSMSDYDKPLLSKKIETARMNDYYNHTFALDNPESPWTAMSPWSANYVNQLLKQQAPNDIATQELGVVKWVRNSPKEIDPKYFTHNNDGYGENFQRHSSAWLDKIVTNMNLSQFPVGGAFNADNRAIAVANLEGRALPTNAPNFYNYTLAGQGYPFDNLQEASVWTGTPLYILGTSKDGAWDMVLTPSVQITWVHSEGVARVKPDFARQWSAMAKQKLGAITQTKTPLVDANNNFLSQAYIGSVFPVASNSNSELSLYVPIKDTDGFATYKLVNVKADQATMMPLKATPHNFAIIMKSLIGRNYGWGGIYFYNDCSQEMQSLYTPFGIWLARNSSYQPQSGVIDDQTKLSSAEARINYLIKHGHKFMTIINIGGHIMQYIGNYKDSSGKTFAMTYQNVWGLAPASRDTRFIIGKSVLFPLLTSYSEEPTAVSEAGKSLFQMAYLDSMPPPINGVINVHDMVLGFKNTN